MTPALSVVVPSHERPLRLRWLLNALEEQTLGRDAWEVIVCHDSGAETEELLATHPLAAAGTLRHLRLAPGTGTVGRQRNAAWRTARAPHVLFTDDDCRPPGDWLERALVAVRADPAAVIQGATRPDPDEALKLRAPGWRSQEIEPPVPWAQGCNILYPCAVLEATGGFDEHFEGGEDTDLAARAEAGGAPYLGAPEMLTYHAIDVLSLRGRVRLAWRWRWLPAVIRRHPHLRRRLPLRVFWKPRHLWLVPAVAGVLGARRRPALAALALPWALAAAPHYGRGVRGRVRGVSELPASAVVDAAEFTALAVGSARARTLLL